MLKQFSVLVPTPCPQELLDEAARLVASWQDLDADRLRAIFLAVVTRVQVHSDRFEVTLDQMGVAMWLNAKDQPTCSPRRS